jgi:hypothetical protein
MNFIWIIYTTLIPFSQRKFSKFITKTKQLFALRITGDTGIRPENKYRALNATRVLHGDLGNKVLNRTEILDICRLGRSV